MRRCVWILAFVVVVFGKESLSEKEVERKTRQAKKEDDPNCLKRWPNAKIRYRMDDTEYPVLPKAIKYIEEAIENWEAVTCLKLEDVTDEPAKWDEPMFVIQSKRIGCWAIIGRDCAHNGQMLNIDRDCAKDTSLIMHEFAHGFGLYHHHVRPDRDQYVRIKEENIYPSRFPDFEIQDVDTYGTPYDYTSLLHYGKYTGSKNKKPTIETVDPLKQLLIGNPKKPSHYDIMLLNKMYNCSGHCVSPPKCENGGFVDKFCKCQCPHNAEGNLCENVTGDYYPQVHNDCGDQVIENDTEIQTYHYNDVHPTDRNEIKCMWYLKAPAGKKAQVTFDKFNLYRHRKCNIDYLEIMMDLYTVDQRVCGNDLEGKTITATQGSMMMVWAEHTPGWRTGFHAYVKFIDDV